MTSARLNRMLWQAGILALFILCGHHGAAAQASLTSMQALDFGQILPGLAETVTVRDAWRRAEVLVQGSGNFDVRVVLPDALVSRDGARIPLTFRDGDAAIEVKESRPISFDPNRSVRVRIPPGHGEALLYLGGTAATTPAQRAGQYTATVVIVVSNTAL